MKELLHEPAPASKLARHDHDALQLAQRHGGLAVSRGRGRSLCHAGDDTSPEPPLDVAAPRTFAPSHGIERG